MKMANEIPVDMLAPCGINCGVCMVHLRKKKPCMGCRGAEDAKPKHCQQCKIKACATEQGIVYCYECSSFPCTRLKHLDARYQRRFQTSLINNALYLKTIGAGQYLSEERVKWLCTDCGGTISMHERVCSECGKETT